MGKKKRGHANIEDILERPWCYYCERDFEDLKLLISHQKAKHFKCDRCGRRLNTAGGLSVHLNQVHKETLNQVENALPNRQGLDVEIFGMEGIPAEILEQHRNRIIQNFYQAQEDRRIATGNPIPGHGKPPRKKIKIETADELKARFAEHRARVAAAKAAGTTLSPAGGMPATASPGAFNNSPYPPPHAAQYGAPPPEAQQYQQPGYGYSPSSLPARPTGGMGAPPGLPQRPDAAGGYGQPPAASGDEIDRYIRMVESGTAKPAKPEEQAPAAEKKAKKGARMVWTDENFSPEELMARLPRYAFVPPAA